MYLKYNLSNNWPIHKQEHLIMLAHKYGKINHIHQNQTFGHLAA